MELAGIPTTPDQGIQSTLLKQLETSKDSGKRSSAFSAASDDAASVELNGVYKSLTVLADEIVSKLDELLADELPDGIRSLRSEDYTPEKTAERIVDGVTGLLGVYAQQNPELEGEELISSFMKEVRSGVEQGYQQAASILGDLGAFSFDGVESGIAETMRLVEEKLVSFEKNYREQNGLATAETPTTEVNTGALATLEANTEVKLSVSATA